MLVSYENTPADLRDLKLERFAKEPGESVVPHPTCIRCSVAVLVDSTEKRVYLELLYVLRLREVLVEPRWISQVLQMTRHCENVVLGDLELRDGPT